MNTVETYHLINIKRTMCELSAYALIATALFTLYRIGLYFAWYSNQYEILIYLAFTSAVVLPLVDYVAAFYFNRYQDAYVSFEGNKIKIRSNVIFKNSGTEEKVIDKNRVESVSLQYKYLPCLERIVVRYDGTIVTLCKKDFKAQDFETIYTELKTGA